MAYLIVTDRDGEVHKVEAKPGLRVMEILRELDYGVAAICGGVCSCATCHVYIPAPWLGKLPSPSSDEQDLLMDLPSYRADASRLSCQVTFNEELSGLALTVAADA